MSSYTQNLRLPSDIQEHLGLLNGITRPSDLVVEFGFRTGISTSAFLAAGARVRSYDIDEGCRKWVRPLAKEYPRRFSFKVGDSRKVEIPECQLLFIDTSHVYETTKIELARHESKVETWIVIHDVTTFGRKDRPPGKGPGIMTAVDEFLSDPDCGWKQWLFLQNSNGMAILKRCE